MKRVEAGTFRMGSAEHYAEEAPVREVALPEFAISPYAVTNAEYAAFVAATGYSTVAERPLDPADFPGAPAANLQPGSMVFTRTRGPVDLRHLNQWWRGCRARRGGTRKGRAARSPGASGIRSCRSPTRTPWPTPTGPACACPARPNGNGRRAANLEGAEFTWGEGPRHDGARLANYWHGDFPWRPEPGYGTTLPVGSFPPNGLGLYDMAGNVWEWTTDWYGGSEAASRDPGQPQFSVPRRVVKGGSFLCADSYCRRYRPAARRPQMIDTGMSHIGFRCAADA